MPLASVMAVKTWPGIAVSDVILIPIPLRGVSPGLSMTLSPSTSQYTVPEMWCANASAGVSTKKRPTSTPLPTIFFIYDVRPHSKRCATCFTIKHGLTT